jgi:hypothetical protein
VAPGAPPFGRGSLGDMPRKGTAKKSVVVQDEADPRFVPVAQAFLRTPGFSLMESRSGAMRGLLVHGKSFGMSQDGRFILKLDEGRVAALVTEGIGKPFSPSTGRVMKGWIEVTHPKADWVALAREAYRLAAAGRPAKKSKRR